MRDLKTQRNIALEVSGVFVAIGPIPNSQVFSSMVELDETGCICVDGLMCTSATGIFAAGDIRRNSPRQVAAAVGDGATAAMSAFRYVQETGKWS